MKKIDKKKKFKKKSFYFEDYAESEIINNSKNTKLIKISLNRITLLFFIFFSIMIIFSIKIIYLSLYPEKDFSSQKNYKKFIKERGDIIDRHGVILARNIDVYDAGVRPKLIKDKKNF